LKLHLEPKIKKSVLISLLGLLGIIAAVVFSYYQIRPPLQPKTTAFELVPVSSYPHIRDRGDLDSLKTAIGNSLDFLAGQPDTKTYLCGDRTISVSRLSRTLEVFSGLLDLNLPPREFQAEFERLFILYRISRIKGRKTTCKPVLTTGYFQPEIQASMHENQNFSYPVYSTPEDLIRVVLSRFDPDLPSMTLTGRLDGRQLIPYYTRTEIDLGRCMKNAGVLAWLKSPVDGLMLHIQGSGILRFQDGSSRYIHFASSNGHPYGSIGKWLVDRGILSIAQADWPGIRAWAEKHPEKFAQALSANPRYIFFRWEKNGPIGSIGKILTPMRSVALDQGIYPPGALYFLEVPMLFCLKSRDRTGSFSGFVTNQDIGSAISGPYRLDMYCGSGVEAGRLAGRMRHSGKLFMVLLKNDCD